jgi:hypothetical protein
MPPAIFLSRENMPRNAASWFLADAANGVIASAGTPWQYSFRSPSKVWPQILHRRRVGISAILIQCPLHFGSIYQPEIVSTRV